MHSITPVAPLAAAAAALLLAGSLTMSMNDAADTIRRLPEPRTRGGLPLTEALAQRRSVRQFTARPLTAAQLGQLCWAAQGITEPDEGYRTAPSAGALYPIELYVATADGVWQYRPATHALERILADDVRPRLERRALNQEWVGAAPACFIIGAEISRTAAKYGGRAERYCLLEAGHVCQNLLLQATALELAGVPVGAFEDAKLATDLQLPKGRRVLYLVPIGPPR